MGTKRSIKHVTNKTEENLSVPPGFMSLTSLTLKRMNTDQEAADPMAVGGESKTGFISASLSSCGIEKFKSTFIQRPWICHDQFDHTPQKYESEPTEVDMRAPVSSCLPKGVIRGCANCCDCVKVTARWHPEESCLPVVDDAPVFRPTEEEFKDTLKYIAKIRPTAENYGICRIVPPASWRPPCLLEDTKTWEASKFSTHVQKIDRLKKLYFKRKLSRLHEKMESEMPKVAESLEPEPCYEGVADSEEAKSTAVISEFENGPEFTLKSFKKYADDFSKQYFCENGKLMNPETSEIVAQDQRKPLIARIEGEYWRIIENPSEEIEVLCGADLGSGFPPAVSLGRNMAEYAESGWNFNNTPKLSGSLLSFGCYNTSAISIPQLFIGMCFTSQCWRNEDHHLYSLSYMHFGDPKVWYGIPGRYCFKFVEVVKKLFPQLLKHPNLLHELVSNTILLSVVSEGEKLLLVLGDDCKVTQLSPSILMSEGIPVYRCLQNPVEFVISFPGAYHSEFSCGFNCSESVCFAPFDWLPHGQNIVELYAGYCLKTSISHDKLLLGAAMEAVTAEWETFTLQKASLRYQIWRSVCGKDGILTRVLKSRVKSEGIRRKYLCNLAQSKAFDEFDFATKRECSICLYDLYLSAVACSCSPNRYSCLRHAKQLCSCAWDAKCFFFRYGMTELDLLVEAVEGKLKAIHSWTKKKVQPDAGHLLNPLDKGPAVMGGQTNLDISHPHKANGIASNKNVMPASKRSAGANEKRAAECTSPSLDRSLRNDASHPTLGLSNPPSGRQNVVKSPVILLSDDEDESP